MVPDLLSAFAVVALASAGIGAWLEYIGHSIHHHHDDEEG